MNNFFTASFVYVATDPYFWPAMAFTTIMGIFIGAVIYNGDLVEIKKGLVALSSYVALILVTNVARIFPQLASVSPDHYYMPFASCATIFFVSIFYLIGMHFGVRITRRAHKGVRK